MLIVANLITQEKGQNNMKKIVCLFSIMLAISVILCMTSLFVFADTEEAASESDAAATETVGEDAEEATSDANAPEESAELLSSDGEEAEDIATEAEGDEKASDPEAGDDTLTIGTSEAASADGE